MSLILSWLTGAGIKIVAGFISQWLDNGRQQMILASRAEKDLILALNSGGDNLSPGGKWTRRGIAVALTLLFCFVVAYSLINCKFLTITKEIPYNPSLLFGWLIGGSSSTTLKVSLLGILISSYLHFMTFVLGFYFTKVSKGG